MTTFEWRAATFCFHNFSRRSAIFRFVVKTFAALRARRFWRRTRSAGTTWGAVARITAVASLASPVFTTRLPRPWVAPLVCLLNDYLTSSSRHSPLVHVVVFVVWHAMCWQLSVARHSSVGIFLEGWRAARILWRRTILVGSWTSLKRWSCLKNMRVNKRLVQAKSYLVLTITFTGTG